jgi:hypothetical protein
MSPAQAADTVAMVAVIAIMVADVAVDAVMAEAATGKYYYLMKSSDKPY